MTQTLSNPQFQNDIRSPESPKIRKGVIYRWIRIFSLLILDSLVLGFSWLLSNRLGISTESFWNFETSPYSLLPVVGVIIGIILAKGLYDEGEKRRDYRALVEAVILGNLLLLLVAFVYAPDQFVSRTQFFLFLLLSILSTFAIHFSVDFGIKKLRSRGIISYPVFLIADPEDEERAIDLIKEESRYVIQGVDSASALDRNQRAKTFAKLKSLGITEAFVTWDAIRRRLFLSWHFQSNGITLRVIPVRDEPLFGGASLWMVGGLPALSFDPPALTGIDFKIKQILDFCCALLGLILASPIYLAIALMIKLDSPGPIFYKQTRIGLHGKPFKAWKFRSMVVNADQLQKELEEKNKTKDGILFKIDDDPRVTRVGKVLRQYSLDELPQIFNVLFGQMSLVGPRPLPERDVAKFSERHFIRHEVLPGITGLWQVSGRSDIIDFEHVLKLDLGYIENWSLWLDFTILLRTVKVVLNKSGAY